MQAIKVKSSSHRISLTQYISLSVGQSWIPDWEQVVLQLTGVDVDILPALGSEGQEQGVGNFSMWTRRGAHKERLWSTCTCTGCLSAVCVHLFWFVIEQWWQLVYMMVMIIVLLLL